MNRRIPVWWIVTVSHAVSQVVRVSVVHSLEIRFEQLGHLNNFCDVFSSDGYRTLIVRPFESFYLRKSHSCLERCDVSAQEQLAPTSWKRDKPLRISRPFHLSFNRSRSSLT